MPEELLPSHNIDKNSLESRLKELKSELVSGLNTQKDDKMASNSPKTKNLSAKSNKKGQNRNKSSQRIRYEAETKLIQKKLGSIEDIRKELGLSQRKISQLLMLDPSCWTRWSKNEDQVPPHIWRAFQWYFALIEKKPEWHPQNSYFASFPSENRAKTTKKDEEKWLKKISDQEKEIHDLTFNIDSLRNHINQIQSRSEKSEKLNISWKMLLLANSVLVFFLLLSQWMN